MLGLFQIVKKRNSGLLIPNNPRSHAITINYFLFTEMPFYLDWHFLLIICFLLVWNHWSVLHHISNQHVVSWLNPTGMCRLCRSRTILSMFRNLGLSRFKITLKSHCDRDMFEQIYLDHSDFSMFFQALTIFCKDLFESFGK